MARVIALPARVPAPACEVISLKAAKADMKRMARIGRAVERAVAELIQDS